MYQFQFYRFLDHQLSGTEQNGLLSFRFQQVHHLSQLQSNDSDDLDEPSYAVLAPQIKATKTEVLLPLQKTPLTAFLYLPRTGLRAPQITYQNTRQNFNKEKFLSRHSSLGLPHILHLRKERRNTWTPTTPPLMSLGCSDSKGQAFL